MLVFLQVTASFKALTQVQPDMAMSFVSEVAKKMGMSHKECDASETDADRTKMENGQDTMPEYMVASPENSDMDIDSNRRQHWYTWSLVCPGQNVVHSL